MRSLVLMPFALILLAGVHLHTIATNAPVTKPWASEVRFPSHLHGASHHYP